jgi:hypothetical protein
MLKQTGFEDVEYKNYISIIFDANSCKIKTFSDTITWEVLYDSTLTKTEIDKIVKSEVQRHKEFIEKKIAEKENK